ncbi:MAG: SDR family oxidoreductase [Gemmatimonadaceae bacterium]|nr:SDR family oxidoreductase [Gemmatimonadaceae bacterium]
MADAFAGKTAIVTGASRGIGSRIALALAGEGARVALVARTRDDLARLATEIANESFVVECDLTNRSDVDRATNAIAKAFGGSPDILVNNAGIFQMSLVEETDDQLFEKMLGTNLVAPFRFMRAFLPAMRIRGSGDIVSIGSVADRKIFDGNAAYSASKFGLRAMHEVLREELRGSGIRSTLVSPSGVDTPLWETVDAPGDPRDRSGMLKADSVVSAVMFALTQPRDVNVYELRLSHS